MKRKIKINFSDFHKGFNPENSEYMNVLREKYDIKDVSAFDMFPNTYHVETICVMERK